MSNSILRQGDVYIRRCPNWDAALASQNALFVKPTGPVLARGETTGHAHVVHANPGATVEVYEDTTPRPGNNLIRALFVKVVGEAGAVIVHEEHAPVHLPEGMYVVYPQREFDPFAAVRRAVID